MIIPKSNFVSLILSVVNDLSRNDKASHTQEAGEESKYGILALL